MKRYITYLKHFYSPKHKDLSQMALESWREYIKDKGRIYNMDVCRAYQEGFIKEYRHNYAISQLESVK
jgi:hypothetical protein